MKKILFILIVLLLVTACATSQPAPTSTAIPPSKTPLPPTSTDTPSPTHTPLPTDTPEPTHTPTPSWKPIEIAELDAALGDEGYRRNPMTTGSGVNGFTWVKENPYERTYTWENGVIRLQVLHDKSPSVRSEHMEYKLMVLDKVFPDGFMAKLREEHTAYNDSVEAKVSGEPEQMFTYGDSWDTKEAEYYVVETDLGDYYVRFSLWWWQSTCPSGYECYYENFPGLDFTGDSSLVFHTILLIPDE